MLLLSGNTPLTFLMEHREIGKLLMGGATQILFENKALRGIFPSKREELTTG
jgi:hypothetical protein